MLKDPELSLSDVLQAKAFSQLPNFDRCRRFCHESWIFPAGVSFALKQNMYWDGFCAFLPDISGLWGGGGPKPCKNQQIWGGRGVFLLEVQYSILKSLISTCVLSYVGSREDWLLDRICESKKDCWDSIRRTSYPYQ